MYLAARQVRAASQPDAGIIARHAAAQRGIQRSLAALIRALPALFHAYIVLVGKKTGEIGRGKALQLIVVVGFDGVHVVIRHFTGGVHRHLLKGDGTGAVNVEMFRFRNFIVAGNVAVGTGRLVAGVARRLAVEHPEGDVNTADLLHMVFVGKGLGQKNLSFIVLLERLDGIFPAELEGKDKVRSQLSGKLPRHDRGVAAIGAGRCRRALVADQLRAAAGAAVRLHVRALLAPVLAEAGGIPIAAVSGRCFLLLCGLFLGRLLRCRGLFLFLRVKRLDLRDVVARAAVVALQFTGRTYEVQRTGTAGALIVGYLCWHRWFHLFHFLP